MLYRYTPSRRERSWTWTSPGAIFATVAWIVLSLLFSLYTANFGKYNETYGALGGHRRVDALALPDGVVVILGAELNREVERQAGTESHRSA